MLQITVADPETRSADLVAENIAQLKALFPDTFTEGKVDFDVLRQLLGDAVDDGEEKYRLNWHGKSHARRLALTLSTGTLRPCPDESVDWDTTRNLMIEGDNLEVLKLLQKSYAGKVKLIYIDPPYNKGKDFIYPDDFRDSLLNYLLLTSQIDTDGQKLTSNRETSGRFHTNWLNMMFPRLKVARNLLSSDGVMFVSIDDGEVANLRKICDELFGEENFVANVVWQKKYTRANDAKWFSDNHDHILIYARHKEELRLAGRARNEEQLKTYSNPDNHEKGPWKATPLHAKSGSNTGSFTFSNGLEWTPPKGTYRRFNDETMRRMDKGGELWFGSDGEQVPSRKSFLSEVKETVTPTTLWLHQEAGHTHEANNDLKALGMGGIFDNPKPVRLIKYMIDLATQPDQSHLVLDFFAGSGTTAQAVMEANAADGGDRRFICAQLPEPVSPSVEVDSVTITNIAELAAERIKRSSRAISTRDGENEVDLGFRYLKLAPSNIKAWDDNPDDLEAALLAHAQHIIPGRSESDVLTELLLKLGLDLCDPVEEKVIAGKTVYCVNSGTLFACLGDGLTNQVAEDLANGIATWRHELVADGTSRIVFKDSGFADDVAKANIVAILDQHGFSDVRSI